MSTSSESDDNLEAFFSSLRNSKQTKAKKLSSSSESLDDFIVDDDYVSFDDGGDKEEEVGKISDLETALSDMSLSNERKHDSKTPRSCRGSYISKRSTAKSNHKKIKQTPIILFSSDDDEDVFVTRDDQERYASPDLRGNLKEDSLDKENDTELLSTFNVKVKSFKTPSYLILSDDSSSSLEEDSDMKKDIPTSSKSSDKPESSTTYTSLVDRILGKVGSNVLRGIENHDNTTSRKKSLPHTSSVKPEFSTPSLPPLKPWMSERVVKTKSLVNSKSAWKKESDGMPPGLPPNCSSAAGFKKQRDILTRTFYDFFNETVFENQLPKDMIVEWDKRLLKTAGVTKCSSRLQSKLEYGMSSSKRTYIARICLSEKVLDTVLRLRDTLCHEMCHAAVWLIDNQSDGHGPFWKSWARKAMKAHPGMPMVKRCHSYEITYKFSYQCTICRKIYGRHSKSVKVDKQACGVCRGKLVLLPPMKNDGTPAKPRQLNKFAHFVKENYNNTKTAISTSGFTPKHSDVMKALSVKFGSLSAKK